MASRALPFYLPFATGDGKLATVVSAAEVAAASEVLAGEAAESKAVRAARVSMENQHVLNIYVCPWKICWAQTSSPTASLIL